jgi:hypothetical protein
MPLCDGYCGVVPLCNGCYGAVPLSVVGVVFRVMDNVA